jgi:outer membrane protein TolC
VVVAKESAERTKRNLEMTARRAAVGTRTQTDVLRWEVQLAADEGGIINAENLLAGARLKLNEVLGVDLHKQYSLEKIVPSDSTISAGEETASLSGEPLAQATPEYYVMNASFLETHPGMRMMEANLRLAEVNIDRSWVNFKPRVNLAFQYGWERNDTPALDGIRPWALSLSLRLPIFNGFGDYTNLERAHADYNRTEAQVESFRRMLLLQATSADLNVNAARKRIEIARKGQRQALDVLNSVSRRYETGGASNVDLIDVQTAYTSAKTNLIAAMYDYYTAQLQLARATGRVAR